MLKSKFVPIPQDPETWGRDAGKHFLITEMPAEKAEKWAIKMFLALKGSGTESQIPLEVRSLGIVGVAIVTINRFLQADVKFENLEPLLDEMFTCVQAVPEPNNLSTARAPLPGEIQEVVTRGFLRSEVLELHTGFSMAESFQKLISEIMISANSLTTPTPPLSSGP